MNFKPKPIRGHNGYDTKQASDDAVHITEEDWGPSLTIQSQAEDADINVIMERFGITGRMPENLRIPTYGDFTGITDFRSAIEATRKAHEDFMQIPAKIRANFDNDPQKFLEWAADPKNLDEMRAMGMAKPLPPTVEKTVEPEKPKSGTT